MRGRHSEMLAGHRSRGGGPPLREEGEPPETARAEAPQRPDIGELRNRDFLVCKMKIMIPITQKCFEDEVERDSICKRPFCQSRHAGDVTKM